MEQFKALEDSEDFKNAIKPPVDNFKKYVPNDKKFSNGIKQFSEWFQKTYKINMEGNYE